MTQQQLMPRTLRRVRLYGPLGVRFGREFHLDVATPGEAVRALTALRPGFDAYLAGSKDNGVGYRVYNGKRMLSEPELVFPANADIRIAPVPLGGKNAGITNIILGTVLIVASFFLPGSQIFLAGVFSAGLSIALGGVVMLLSPPPKDGKSKDKPENEPNYAFNGPVNTQAQGNPVPVLYGELYTGSAVISAGINVDDVYIPQGEYSEVADRLTSLAAGVWEFDGTMLDTNGLRGWTNYFGGPVYAPGQTGQELVVVGGVFNNMVSIAPHRSWSIAFVARVAADRPYPTYFGYGQLDTFAVYEGGYATINVIDTGFGYVTKVRVGARPNDGSPHQQGAYHDIGLGHHLFVLRYNHINETLTLALDSSAVPISSVALMSYGGLYGAAGEVPFVKGYGYTAFEEQQQHTEDWWIFHDYILTAEDQQFLAQRMTYAQTLAVSSPPSGTGSGGGDMWDLARQALGG